MKSERRRNVRVPVRMPMIMRSSEAAANMKVNTADLSAGGVAVVLPSDRVLSGAGRLRLRCLEPAGSCGFQQSSHGKAQGRGRDFGSSRPRGHDTTPRVVETEFSRCRAGRSAHPLPAYGSEHGGCYLAISSLFPVSRRLTLASHRSSRAGWFE